MSGIYGFEGFVDSYYDTMGKAEELYEYFIEEAVKLYHEINRLDNVISKPFFAIGTLEGVWESRQEVRDRFDDWVNDVRARFSEIVKKSGLYVVEFGSEWIVLPFDLSVIPYTYDNDFSTLVDILTDGELRYNDCGYYGVYDFDEYSQEIYDESEAIEVFKRGLEQIKSIRNDKIPAVKKLCEELREQLDARKLFDDCEKHVLREDK